MKLSLRLLSLTAILAALLLAGCGDDGDTVNNAAPIPPTTGTENFGAVTVDVVGNVVDTNGVPVAGATVSVAGFPSVTTNTAGEYRLEDIQATGASDPVAGLNPGTSCPNCTRALAVTIVPPAGYLGAAVSVNPSAVVFTGDSGAPGGPGDYTVFIDDTLVGAGLAVLPATTANVNGQIRDALTGLPVAGLTVSLDFTGLSNVAAIPDALPTPNEGVPVNVNTISYIAAPANLVTTTDASGNYSFTNVPQDSFLNLGISGSFYQINAVNNGVALPPATTIAPINTAQEGIGNTFNLAVQEVASLDTVPPYISQVDGTARATFAAAPVLKDGVDGLNNPIVITFSEALTAQTFGFAEIVVVNDSDGVSYNTDFTRTALTGNVLSIYTTAAIPKGGKNLRVLVLLQKLQDPAQNLISEPLPLDTSTGTPIPGVPALGAAGPSVNPPLPGGAPALTGTYLALTIQTFIQAVPDAEAVENLTQFFGNEGPVQTVEGSTDAFKNALSGFRPTDPALAGVLSANTNSAANGNDVNVRLQQLAVARGEVATAGAFLNNVARLDFATKNAASYSLAVTAANGTSKAFIAHQSNGNVIGGFGGPAPAPVYSTASNATDGFAVNKADAFVVLSGVVPGDTVTITPVNGVGVAGTAQSITLADVVPPTTVLQPSYGFNPGVLGTVTGTSTTSGGQLITAPGTPGGSPILALTTTLLANAQANIPWTGRNAALTGSNYDATAYNATTFVRRFGAAFSEPIAFTSTGKADVQARVNQGVLNTLLTVEDPQNNLAVTAPAPGGPQFADVVALSGDIQAMSLALPAAGQSIDFDTTIQDLAATANVTTGKTNAAIVIQERIPPLVKRAYYTGDTFVVEFNEPIASTWAPLTLNGKNIARGAPGVTTNASRDTITVNLLATGAVDISSADFGAPNYAEAAAYTGIPNSTGAKNHALLDFSAVADAKDATTTWTTQGVNPPPVTVPQFAAIDLLGPFTGSCVVPSGGQFTSNTTVVSGTARNLATQRVRCTFSHPLLNRASARVIGTGTAAAPQFDSQATVGVSTANPPNLAALEYDPAATGNGDFLLNVNDIESFFGVESNANPPVVRTVNFTGSNVLSADGKVIDFAFTVTGGVQPNDRFVLDAGAFLRSAFIPVSDLTGAVTDSRFVLNPGQGPATTVAPRLAPLSASTN